jgi:HdeA/HdeB family
MRRRVALSIAAVIALQVCCLSARAATSNFPCDAFAKNPDGSWTVLKTTYLEGPDVKVQEDATFAPGRVIRGYDIADLIAKACPNAVVAPSPGTEPAAAQGAAPVAAPSTGLSTAPGTAPNAAAPQPQSFLARYADANGNLDVRQLTCGHLDDTSAEEAELFLAWYSGWYSGVAKNRGINLARIRYAIRNVVAYCKGDRNKKLSEVMDQMLK